MAETRVTREDLAEILGLTPVRVSQLKKEYNDFPFRKQGHTITFPVARCVKWYVAFKVKEALARASTEKPDRARHAKEREAEVDAAMKELRYAERRGELVSRTAVRTEYARLAGEVRAVLDTMPGQHAHRVVGLPDLAAANRALDQVRRDVLAQCRVLADGDVHDQAATRGAA